MAFQTESCYTVIRLTIGVCRSAKGTIAMKVSYNGLWKIMIDKGLQKQDLVKKAGLSSATVAKMGKGEAVSNKVLEKLAKYLECNISEIISYE